MSLDLDLSPQVEIQDHDRDDTRCQVSVCFSVVCLRWSRTWERACRRKAKTAVIVSCLRHGEVRQGICRPHLALLKRSQDCMTCADCGLPVLWRLA